MASQNTNPARSLKSAPSGRGTPHDIISSINTLVKKIDKEADEFLLDRLLQTVLNPQPLTEKQKEWVMSSERRTLVKKGILRPYKQVLDDIYVSCRSTILEHLSQDYE